jgi:hypothetical protein
MPTTICDPQREFVARLVDANSEGKCTHLNNPSRCNRTLKSVAAVFLVNADYNSCSLACGYITD